MTDTAQDRLSRGFRVIRAVAGDRESPWPGTLVSTPGGRMGIAVDADVLGADWAGWDAAPDDHILAPFDILRRVDGHDALLPVCVERLEEFLARRVADDVDLSPGEGVTVAVSLLRGLGALRNGSEEPGGSWWLTDEGRPVLALGSARDPAAEMTLQLLRDLGRDVPIVADALAAALEAASEPRRLIRELDRAEDRLFDIAEPAALATTTFGPKRARTRLLPDAADGVPATHLDTSPWQFALLRHLDADWADLLSRATTGLWRRARTRRPASRRPWLVAGGLAGMIVVGGLLWPGPGGPATAEVSEATVPATADPAAASPAPDQAPEQPTPAVGSDDLAAIADALLGQRVACREDADCLVAVLETPGAEFPPGVVDLPQPERSVALLDDFGGAAVLRAQAAAGPAQLVVIVRTGERWLLRDVYDVAEQ